MGIALALRCPPFIAGVHLWCADTDRELDDLPTPDSSRSFGSCPERAWFDKDLADSFLMPR